MEFNYVGLDLSLSSSACYIKKLDDSEFYYNYRSSDKLSKWHKMLSFIKYLSYSPDSVKEYSDDEINKLVAYDNITDLIVNNILKHCNPEETIIVTEGYSYSSSNTSSLIDLIGYATLLRSKLVKLNFHKIIIKSPSTLKLETCKITYKAEEKPIGGKNPRIEYIYKNDDGIAGGSFTKNEMLKSVLDNDAINIQIKTALIPYQKELLEMKSIPKPIDDVIDSVLLVYTESLKNI